MRFEPTKKETSAPVTAARSGRGSSEAYRLILRKTKRDMPHAFIQQVEMHISSERLLAYAMRHDGHIDPKITLARYMLNMALCESFYPALQRVTAAMDRFQSVRAAGLTPFLSRAVWEPKTP